MEVHGLNGVTSNRVNRVQDLTHFYEVPIVLTITVPSTFAEACNERGTCNRSENQMIAPEHQVAMWIAAVQ